MTKSQIKYYKINKDTILAKQKSMRTIINQRAKKSRDKTKDAVFQYYGERCTCCGEDRRVFLTIDHINGGGHKHRKELGNGNYSGSYLYTWIKNNGFPQGFQILCMNCNWAKRMGGCPHVSL